MSSTCFIGNKNAMRQHGIFASSVRLRWSAIFHSFITFIKTLKTQMEFIKCDDALCVDVEVEVDASAAFLHRLCYTILLFRSNCDDKNGER